MKQNILIIIFIFFGLNCYSQENEFYELLEYPKVLINEKLVAYTVTYQETRNGVELEEEMPEPSIERPYFISISSYKNYGQISIKSDEYDNNLTINFSVIYQAPRKDNSIMYLFHTTDKRYSAAYVHNMDFNDFLFITINGDDNNSLRISYTKAEL